MLFRRCLESRAWYIAQVAVGCLLTISIHADDHTDSVKATSESGQLGISDWLSRLAINHVPLPQLTGLQFTLTRQHLYSLKSPYASNLSPPRARLPTATPMACT